MTIEVNNNTYLASPDGKYYGRYPAGDAPVGGGGTRTVNGTGFGATGPTVVFYDTFEANTDGQLISLAGPEIGVWDQYNNDTAGSTNTAYASDFDGKTWLASRQPQNVAQDAQNLSSLLMDLGTPYKDFTRSWRWVVPTGFKFTDSANPNEIAGSATSRFKMDWLLDQSLSTNPDDLVIATVIANSISNVGNGVDPESLSGGRTFFSFGNCSGVNENLFIYSQTENTGSNWDGVLDIMQHTSGYWARSEETDCKPFEPNAGTPPFPGYSKAYFPGLLTNHSNGYVNSQTLFKDVYFAVGAGHRAMVLVHDATTLAASTNVYIVPPDTWSDTEVTFTPKPYQDLTYVSIINANGVLQENV